MDNQSEDDDEGDDDDNENRLDKTFQSKTIFRQSVQPSNHPQSNTTSSSAQPTKSTKNKDTGNEKKRAPLREIHNVLPLTTSGLMFHNSIIANRGW
jgi:hypothetical protein